MNVIHILYLSLILLTSKVWLVVRDANFHNNISITDLLMQQPYVIQDMGEKGSSLKLYVYTTFTISGYFLDSFIPLVYTLLPEN